MKRQPTEEKIFTINISTEVPYPDYIKNFYETVTKRESNDRKMGKKLAQTIHKKRIYQYKLLIIILKVAQVHYHQGNIN